LTIRVGSAPPHEPRPGSTMQILRWDGNRDGLGGLRIHPRSDGDRLRLHTGGGVRFAVADPPYIGQAQRHYKCPEIDHNLLVHRLVNFYPDGWVLCLSSPTLKGILNLCPDDVRVGAWVKPFASFKPGVNPAYAWEPVIWRGGRKRDRTVLTVRDWVSASITLKKGLAGAKPPKFCDWVFDLLGATDEDEIDDLFPGTGVVTARWKARQGKLALA